MRWALLLMPLLGGCFLERSGLVDHAFDGGVPDAGADGGSDAGPTECTPSAEICDGLDNDCDPTTADGMSDLGMPCDGADQDLCQDDTVVGCAGAGRVCGTSSDNVEVCNGVDDDCDGTTDDGGCPCNVERFEGHIYLFCDSPRSWTDALAVCPAGYSLAQITSEQEQAFVQRTALALSSGDFWIGARDTREEGVFRWEGDGSLVPPDTGPGFERWGELQPDGTGDCLELDLDGSTGPIGSWNDAACSDPNRSVCESSP